MPLPFKRVTSANVDNFTFFDLKTKTQPITLMFYTMYLHPEIKTISLKADVTSVFGEDNFNPDPLVDVAPTGLNLQKLIKLYPYIYLFDMEFTYHGIKMKANARQSEYEGDWQVELDFAHDISREIELDKLADEIEAGMVAIDTNTYKGWLKSLPVDTKDQIIISSKFDCIPQENKELHDTIMTYEKMLQSNCDNNKSIVEEKLIKLLTSVKFYIPQVKRDRDQTTQFDRAFVFNMLEDLERITTPIFTDKTYGELFVQDSEDFCGFKEMTLLELEQSTRWFSCVLNPGVLNWFFDAKDIEKLFK